MTVRPPSSFVLVSILGLMLVLGCSDDGGEPKKRSAEQEPAEASAAATQPAETPAAPAETPAEDPEPAGEGDLASVLEEGDESALDKMAPQDLLSGLSSLLGGGQLSGILGNLDPSMLTKLTGIIGGLQGGGQSLDLQALLGKILQGGGGSAGGGGTPGVGLTPGLPSGCKVTDGKSCVTCASSKACLSSPLTDPKTQCGFNASQLQCTVNGSTATVSL